MLRRRYIKARARMHADTLSERMDLMMMIYVPFLLFISFSIFSFLSHFTSVISTCNNIGSIIMQNNGIEEKMLIRQLSNTYLLLKHINITF